jgi:hypothetical protein
MGPASSKNKGDIVVKKAQLPKTTGDKVSKSTHETEVVDQVKEEKKVNNIFGNKDSGVKSWSKIMSVDIPKRVSKFTHYLIHSHEK